MGGRDRSGLRQGRKAVVTVGVFDGVHLGHKRILEEVVLLARGLRARSVVVTFDPHPVAVLNPGEAPAMLTTVRERLDLIAAEGISETLVMRFGAKLAARDAEWFVRHVLLGRLGMGRLVIGYDFRFGRGREGGARGLETLGEAMGFGVDIVPPVKLGGHPVSSTRARTALARGDVRSAAAMLGRPYQVSGRVVRGEGRGRRLGFPTANLQPGDIGKMVPGDGVYAAEAGSRGRLRPALVYVGARPTYGVGARGIEVHILDAGVNLYGESLRVRFIDRLRGEKTFASEAALRRAMLADRRRLETVIGK
ncbi:MAG: riboflavin biosynthesis protein RibF [bacterium]